jgi:5-formyltetrahydrofolate cyclo-ligase
MSDSSHSTERERLRRSMRSRRRVLTAAQRDDAARRIAVIADSHRLLRPGRRIAVYLAQGSEADCAPLIEIARRRGCVIHVPVITSYRLRRMEFVRYEPKAVLRTNRHGIDEPDPRLATRVPLRSLDVVFVPLVAFDLRGWRLGSGAGYYDRRLHPLLRGAWRRPKVIGVAYDFQRVPELAAERWDVPMDAVVTDAAMHRTQRSSRCDEHGERRPTVK